MEGEPQAIWYQMEMGGEAGGNGLQFGMWLQALTDNMCQMYQVQQGKLTPRALMWEIYQRYGVGMPYEDFVPRWDVCRCGPHPWQVVVAGCVCHLSQGAHVGQKSGARAFDWRTRMLERTWTLL